MQWIPRKIPLAFLNLPFSVKADPSMFIGRVQYFTSSSSISRLTYFYVLVCTFFILLFIFFTLHCESHHILRFLCSVSFDDRIKRVLKCSQLQRQPFIGKHLILHNFVEPLYQISGKTELEDLVVRPQLEGETCFDETPFWREREALVALHAAKRFRKEGNLKRARNIIEHAYSLAPYNADILTEYGIHFEIQGGDVVAAEGFYLKAIMRNPKHEEALIRRQRTLPLVEAIDNRMMREINRKLKKFESIPHSDAGLRRAMRESYFAHVYHTVAMEGNTINLAQTRSILETKMAVAGKSIVEHNEILGLDAALRFLNQSLAKNGLHDFTLEHILALHKRVLGFADPISAGVLRMVQVFVGKFRPTEPEFVLAEMEELVHWLNDDETLALDPVEAAALAHYKLVFIHPFIDGNGRTARLLMNWILLRAGFPPVIIPVEMRSRYYDVLREANEGDLRPFIRFIAQLTDKALESLITSSVSSLCEIGDCPTRETRDNQMEHNTETIENQPFCVIEPEQN